MHIPLDISGVVRQEEADLEEEEEDLPQETPEKPKKEPKKQKKDKVFFYLLNLLINEKGWMGKRNKLNGVNLFSCRVPSALPSSNLKDLKKLRSQTPLQKRKRQRPGVRNHLRSE